MMYHYQFNKLGDNGDKGKIFSRKFVGDKGMIRVKEKTLPDIQYNESV